MFRSSPSVPLKKSSRTVLKVAGVALAIVVALGVLVATLPQLTGNRVNAPQQTNGPPPKIEIVNTSFRAGTDLVYVDVSLKNNGGAGTLLVHAAVGDGSNTYNKNETIHFAEQESKDTTFTFEGVTFSNLSDVHAYSWIELLPNPSE